MYVTFTRKGIAAAICVLLLAVAVCSQISAASSSPKDAATNAQRIDFITRLCIEVDENTAEVAEITVPAEFSQVYERYNALQLAAGYDLSHYKGCEAVRYTYSVKGEENTVVNLLVYKGRVIGGDISSIGLNGSMEPLKKQEN